MNTLVLPAHPRPGLRFVADLAQWSAKAAQRRRLRAQTQELAALGEREFSDLGVGRSELPYWLAPDAGNKAGRP